MDTKMNMLIRKYNYLEMLLKDLELCNTATRKDRVKALKAKQKIDLWCVKYGYKVTYTSYLYLCKHGKQYFCTQAKLNCYF